MEQETRKQDWERFCALGRPPVGLRAVVLESWTRVAKLGGIAQRRRAPLVEAEEFARLHLANRDLLEAAQRHLAQNAALLRDAQSIMVLCDPRGVVLQADGCLAVLDQAHDDRLLLGGRWDEVAIGTNAIGTALHTGRPVQICGPEHFCEVIQKWNCAAVPLRHPATGRVLGVLDVTAPCAVPQPQAAALSLAVAGQIGQTLAQGVLQDRAALLEGLLARRMAGPFMLFDRFGQRVMTRAPDGLADQALRGVSDIAALIGGLCHDDDDLDLRILRASAPGVDPEILRHGGAVLGVVLHLRQSAPPLPPSTPVPAAKLGLTAAPGPPGGPSDPAVSGALDQIARVLFFTQN